jgi:hypothetical protein
MEFGGLHDTTSTYDDKMGYIAELREKKGLPALPVSPVAAAATALHSKQG